MFLTSQQAQIDELGLVAPTFSAWAYVEHTLQRPWFYVATTTIGPDGVSSVFSMIMACSEPMLSTILGFHGRTLRVESVLLVSPAHINQTGDWQMQPLERLEKYSSAAATAFVYWLLDGKKYVYGDNNALNAIVVDIDQIFANSMIIEKKEFRANT